MSTQKPALLILAAGIGSRYGSLKQIDRVGPSGETIMDYSIYDAIKAGFGKVVFVISKNLEGDFKVLFEKYSKRIKVEYVIQELHAIPEGIEVPSERVKPWGTGHAIMVAAPKINEPFVAINADDYYGAGSFKIIADYFNQKHDDDRTKYCLVGYQLQNTLSEFGYVSRGVCNSDKNNFLTSVVERVHIQRIDGKIIYSENNQPYELTGNEFVSMNFWGFPPSVFDQLKKKFKIFIEKNADNIKSEFFIPFVVNDLINENLAMVKVLKTPDSWFGVTYKEDKITAVETLKSLVKRGVYPENLWG